jgi:hypothetical protein
MVTTLDMDTFEHIRMRSGGHAGVGGSNSTDQVWHTSPNSGSGKSGDGSTVRSI